MEDFNRVLSVNKVSNHLEISGVDTLELTKIYGTPLYVYSENFLEENIAIFKSNFKSDIFKCRVIYASKAFLTSALINLLDKHEMSIDVVSGGELYVVNKNNFKHENIIVHGNNKTLEEIKLAIDLNIVYNNVSNI